eukprot:gene7665-8470_t
MTMTLKKTWHWLIEQLGIFIRHVATPLLLPIIEQNIFPDFLLRIAIRQEIEMELAKIKKLTIEEKASFLQKFVEELRQSPIAIQQKAANEQHYEVPDEFYQLVLGPRLKYSSGYWTAVEGSGYCSLAQSEIVMLDLYCQRAEIADGMKIVDLGCGWGSVTLYLAERYPKATILSISNSVSQREYIEKTAVERGLTNITVFTGDITVFTLPDEHLETIDRVISIEMFEHMKNYALLMHKISTWLKTGGKLFVHIFTHVEMPGHYESGWMTENFFTGGTLPSDDLLLYFQEDLHIEKHWLVNGQHYQKTLEAWLQVMDIKKAVVLPLLGKVYGPDQALKRFVYWRLFFMGCAEFFGIRQGEEYLVSHYLFAK